MSTIDLKWRDRDLTAKQLPRRFLDFIIDGQSLYDQLGDLISPLGWFPPKYHQVAIDRFLLLGPPDFPDGRRSICVCGECGDLGCGALAAVIENVGDRIVWKDFKYQNNYDPDIGYVDGDYSHLGPFSFDVDQYIDTIRKAVTLYR